MIKLFQNPDSETTVKYIAKIKKKIEELKDFDGSCYIGYPEPIINNQQESELLSLLIINGNAIYYFYDDDSRQKNSKRFLLSKITQSKELFEIVDEALIPIDINNIDNFVIDNKITILSNDLYRRFISLIQDIYNLAKEDNREISNINGLGALIKKRNESFKELDEGQYQAIHSKLAHHTRIRGLAGSGKTIIMVEKMAHLHFQYPEKIIVYTYTSKSLGEFVRTLFEKAYSELTREKPNYKNVKIMHTWGSTFINGVYRDICRANNEQSLPFKSEIGIISFSAACRIILPKAKVLLYDFVFIDEAQDVPLSFYKIVLSSLKKGGKIIYAYDEMQSFNKSSVPNKSEIFGKYVSVKDINLAKSYRTPMQILVTAHAIGMGIYNYDETGQRQIKNFVGDESTWDVVGYLSSPLKIVKGKEVKLSRKFEKDEINEYKSSDYPLIKFIKLENFQEQVEYVTKELKDLIKKEDIKAEDVLVIDLNSTSYKDNFLVFNKLLYQELIPLNDAKLNSNLIDDNSDLTFRIKDSVPYTSINRSKGNEASIVYILNGDHDNVHESYWRRRIFTAMTRSKYLVRVLGGDDIILNLAKEYNEVDKNNYSLIFDYPTTEEMKDIFTLAKNDEEEVKQMDSSVQIFDSFDSVDKQLELLARQVGVKREELPQDIVEMVKKKKIQ